MLQNHTPRNKNGEHILFFCRHGCGYSQKCLDLLLELNYEVSTVWSDKKGEKLPAGLYDIKYDYILSFRSYFIIPLKLINRTKKYCINFHPGPPSYPGIGCINFSIYNEEPNFGITVHLMEKTIDTGDIIDCAYFPVEKDEELLPILKKTHQLLYEYFVKLAHGISQEGAGYIERKLEENKDVKWTGNYKSYKDFEKFLEVNKSVDEVELRKRIKAFQHPNFPLHVKLHGKKFYLKSED